MKEIQITDEFKKYCGNAQKENRGSSLRPFKYSKKVDGKEVPVFFIGVPGIYVALAVSLLLITTVYLITLTFNVFVWLVYLVIVFLILRLALKADKAGQIRFMAMCLCAQAMNLLEKANTEAADRARLVGQAKYLLEKAYAWVDEPSVGRQLELLEDYKSIPFE